MRLDPAGKIAAAAPGDRRPDRVGTDPGRRTDYDRQMRAELESGRALIAQGLGLNGSPRELTDKMFPLGLLRDRLLRPHPIKRCLATLWTCIRFSGTIFL